ncbi:MAG TPA: hypothetical protein VHG70_16150, partial [Nocardioidaceae bacterium]|nr:hypothetical protein [Nocardioidaceae bacterium]
MRALREFLEQPPPWARRVARGFGAAEVAIGGVFLLVILALVLLQAGQRYLPIEGWPAWSRTRARITSRKTPPRAT